MLHTATDPLSRARAYAELGASLRRSGRPVDAREPLRLAVDLAHRCGAIALEQQALAELRAAGARPRRPLIAGAGGLTPSERRIAELAAAGRQNRDIAAELVVTVSTVEYHLRNAYRKLGIASRTGLREALGMHTGPGATLNVHLATGNNTVFQPTSHLQPSTTGSTFKRRGHRSRSAPNRMPSYSRWESRSNAATSTL